MNNKSIVDIVENAVTKLGNTKPGMFQANGIIYIANERALGGVFPGAQVPKESAPGWSNAIGPKNKSENEPQKPSFTEAGELLFEKFPYNPNTSALQFDQLRKYGASLVPRQGERFSVVPVIGSVTSHRSHKYGYANDGVDNWITTALLCDEGVFRGAAREAEHTMWKQLLGNKDAFRRSWRIPYAFVLTPDVLIQFPRAGKLDYHKSAMEWSDNQVVNGFDGWLTTQNETDLYGERPFRPHIVMNTLRYSGDSMPEMYETLVSDGQRRAKIGETLQYILENVDAVTRQLNALWQFTGANEHASEASLKHKAKKRNTQPF